MLVGVGSAWLGRIMGPCGLACQPCWPSELPDYAESPSLLPHLAPPAYRLGPKNLTVVLLAVSMAWLRNDLHPQD